MYCRKKCYNDKARKEPTNQTERILPRQSFFNNAVKCVNNDNVLEHRYRTRSRPLAFYSRNGGVVAGQ